MVNNGRDCGPIPITDGRIPNGHLHNKNYQMRHKKTIDLPIINLILKLNPMYYIVNVKPSACLVKNATFQRRGL